MKELIVSRTLLDTLTVKKYMSLEEIVSFEGDIKSFIENDLKSQLGAVLVDKLIQYHDKDVRVVLSKETSEHPWNNTHTFALIAKIYEVKAGETDA
jgi:hypothetical protein